MDKKKTNILFAIVAVLILCGLGFIFRDKIFVDGSHNTGVIVEDDGIVKIKNLIKINAGAFDVKTLKVKQGEVVTFVNEDNTPHKIIGDGWQSAYFEKTGSFSKNDFKVGENVVYIENLPDSQVKIIVK